MTSPVVSERNAAGSAHPPHEELSRELARYRRVDAERDVLTLSVRFLDALVQEYADRASPVLVSREPRWQDDPKVKALRNGIWNNTLVDVAADEDEQASLNAALDALCEAVAASPSGASPAAPDTEDAVKRGLTNRVNALHRALSDIYETVRRQSIDHQISIDRQELLEGTRIPVEGLSIGLMCRAKHALSESAALSPSGSAK